MCSNYEPVTASDRLLAFFGVVRGDNELPFEFQKQAWPTALAPFIRLDQNGRRRIEAGRWGLLPHFAKELAYGRRTYNARTETVATLPSFKDAWKRGQRCIVPAESVFEPCWETGKAVRWRIQQPGGVPMGIAGLWADHPTLKDGSGEPVLSFTMLTVNADGHPVFQRMHKPGDEKRMVVILAPDDYDHWLTCDHDEARRLCRQWLGPLDASPAPLPPRKSAAKKGEPSPDDSGDLF